MKRFWWRGVQVVGGLLVLAGVGVKVWWTYLEHRFNTVVQPQCQTFARGYDVGDPASGSVTCLILGDSTAFGAGASRVERSFPYLAVQEYAARGHLVHVTNRAVIGARAAEVAAQASGLKPDFAIVSIGANDATHFTSPDAYRTSLATLLDGMAAVPRVYFATAPDMGVVPALPWGLAQIVRSRVQDQNAILRGLVAPRPNVFLVDLYEDGKLDPRVNPGFYAADSFHPSDTGYAVWGSLMQQAVRRSLSVRQ